MKTTKTIYLITLAMVLMFSAVGCKRTKYQTKLPDPKATGGGNVGELPPSPPVGTEGGIGNTPTSDFDLNSYNQDASALAAYTVHFDYDSSTVKSSESHNVQAVANALASDANLKLLIEGHCDERGTEEYNRSLGERRALALREALTQMGLDPMRVKTISYGEDKPVATGNSEAAWKQNRRGVFILLHPK